MAEQIEASNVAEFANNYVDRYNHVDDVEFRGDEVVIKPADDHETTVSPDLLNSMEKFGYELKGCYTAEIVFEPEPTPNVVVPQELRTATTDSRGRINLGSEFADKTVQVGVLKVIEE